MLECHVGEVHNKKGDPTETITVQRTNHVPHGIIHAENAFVSQAATIEDSEDTGKLNLGVES